VATSEGNDQMLLLPIKVTETPTLTFIILSLITRPHRFPFTRILQVTEGWVEPGNEATFSLEVFFCCDQMDN